jgi:putative transcriptional regulator
MKSSLKARLERLGPVRGVDRVKSGSPAVIVIRPRPGNSPGRVKSVDAALALARRGLSLVKAKHVIEEVLEKGEAIVELPTVENVRHIASDLAMAGLQTGTIARLDAVDVRGIRAKLNLTQEQFALRYGFKKAALANWEQGRRQPDRATQAYLHLIARDPEAVRRIHENEIK